MTANRFIAVISDTHGLVRPEAIAAVEGAAMIIHAGDIGGESIIRQFAAIAPVTYVRGNCDYCTWAQQLPDEEVVKYNDSYLYITHIRKDMDIDPAAAGFDVVINGHTHKPQIEYINDVLYLNPGSCGPRRFDLPVSIGRINITPSGLTPEIIEIL